MSAYFTNSLTPPTGLGLLASPSPQVPFRSGSASPDGSVVSSPGMNDPQPEGHMASYIRRRKFLATLLGAAAAWPLAARAQQSERMPVVGLLHPTSLDAVSSRLRAFHQGLKETGF